MNTLTIELSDSIFTKLNAFARRAGKSPADIVASVTAHELEAMEQFEALQREAKKLTHEEIEAAFDEIRALNAPPLPGDEMPDLP